MAGSVVYGRRSDGHRAVGRTVEDSSHRVARAGGSHQGLGWWGAVYRLGPERGMFRIDSEMLIVRFDQDDRVVEYRIVTD